MKAVLIFLGAAVSRVLVTPPLRHGVVEDVVAGERVAELLLVEDVLEVVRPHVPQEDGAVRVPRPPHVLEEALEEELVVLLSALLDGLEAEHVEVVLDGAGVAGESTAAPALRRTCA